MSASDLLISWNFLHHSGFRMWGAAPRQLCIRGFTHRETMCPRDQHSEGWHHTIRMPGKFVKGELPIIICIPFSDIKKVCFAYHLLLFSFTSNVSRNFPSHYWSIRYCWCTLCLLVFMAYCVHTTLSPSHSQRVSDL